jgi:Domain of unknown function (DUF4159)
MKCLLAHRLPLVLFVACFLSRSSARADVTAEQVDASIKAAIRYLKAAQQADGSWPEFSRDGYPKGTSAIATLALITAGESPDDPVIRKALANLEEADAWQLKQIYCVALQTMAFAAADPERYKARLVDNVRYIEDSQVQNPAAGPTLGGWSYTLNDSRPPDNSNSQYALLGLNAANEVGVEVKQKTWNLARTYWEQAQRTSGAWSYRPDDNSISASMTTAGISSMIITGMRRLQSREVLVGDVINNCGQGGVNPGLQRALDWMAANFRVDQNVGHGRTWKYYYLYGLERAGRLSGQRFFGSHDWYYEGAEELLALQDRLTGNWPGNAAEDNPILTTSFSLLFLAKGRSPVLINRLRHGNGDYWDSHREGVRHIVDVVSRDWKFFMSFQTVNPDFAKVEDLLQAPICFLNYHQPIGLGDEGKKALKTYIEQGGFLFGEACCSKPEHDAGFRALVAEIFPKEQGYELKPLAEEHPVWRARYQLDPGATPLWGIELGCRTVLIYSPQDLSGYWSHIYTQPDNAAVIKARRVGQNIIDYATGREPPEPKLKAREVVEFKAEAPKRGALQIAKLRHAGGWNVAPLAIPNLTSLLRDRLGHDVVLNHKELLPGDPNLINYPLVYIHGRAGFSFSEEELQKLRDHLDPGGGTLFADSACGATAFDTAFRKFAAELYPERPLEPIPADDDLYSKRVGFDLAQVELTKAAGGGLERPRLEGVKINGHWSIIYSPLDIGCALERQQGLDCKGYTHESALRIAANIVIYSTLP